MELRALLDGDEVELCELMRRCLEHDGGLPMAMEPEMVRQLFLAGEGVCARSADGDLSAAGALHISPRTGAREFTGAVDPGHRGRGLGTSLLAWATSVADPQRVVRSESLTDPAVQLFSRHGFHGAFEEIVMHRATAALPPDGRFEEYKIWSARSARDFFDAYVASFSARPGFPRWTLERWTKEMTSDDDFSSDSSIVVLAQGTPVGFLLVAGRWIEQVGVVPDARRRGIGTELVSFALRRIAESGAEEAWLNVSADNPRAISLYRRLGFDAYGRRGRFRRLD
ncbi:MAG TPA: GNAT family N-acetyltransferase [Acidimicrobiales bacterium]|jgi:mycothiol synthase|nr:GNAT family N-acetyltransferase [Acidimicrobiales bacterium]